MAARRVIVVEDIRLDMLAAELLGTASKGGLEALLRANPGLAAKGLYVLAGTPVSVPELDPTPALLPSVNPWE